MSKVVFAAADWGDEAEVSGKGGASFTDWGTRPPPKSKSLVQSSSVAALAGAGAIGDPTDAATEKKKNSKGRQRTTAATAQMRDQKNVVPPVRKVRRKKGKGKRDKEREGQTAPPPTSGTHTHSTPPHTPASSTNDDSASQPATLPLPTAANSIVKKAGSKKKKKGPKIPPSESEVTDGAGATPTKTEKGAGAGGQSHSHSHSTAAPHPTADVQPKRQSKKAKRKAAADAPSDPRPAKVTKASVPDKRDPDVAVSSDSSHARTATHGGIADRAAAPQRNTPARKPSKAAKRLQGARFRMLNEKLYTTDGNSALELFSANPDLFDVYHQGFQTQVEKWPVNPVDRAIEWITSRDKGLVVVDLGCGEAALAQSVPNQVHSFDLISPNEHVIACDIAHVPLDDAIADVAVFSLVSTPPTVSGSAYFTSRCLDPTRGLHLLAHRILKENGHLLIYEVVSRIDDLDVFVATVEGVGFKCSFRDESNKMFVEVHFEARSVDTGATAAAPATLNPCIYKRR